MKNPKHEIRNSFKEWVCEIVMPDLIRHPGRGHSVKRKHTLQYKDPVMYRTVWTPDQVRGDTAPVNFKL